MAQEFNIPGLREAIENVKLLQDQVALAAKEFLNVSINAEKAVKSVGGDGFKKYSDTLKTSKEETDKLEVAKKRLLQAESDQAKEIAKVNLQIAEQISKNKTLAAAESENATALQKYNAKILEATKASKELGAQMTLLALDGKKNTDEYKELEKAFMQASAKSKLLNDSYREISKTAGDNRALVGSYSDELKGHFDMINGSINSLKGNVASGNYAGAFNDARTIITGFGHAVKKGTDETKGINDELGKSGSVLNNIGEKFKFGAKCSVDFFKPSEENSKKLTSSLERVKIGFTGSADAVNKLKNSSDEATESTNKGNIATQLWSRTQLIFAGSTGIVSTSFNVLKIAIASTGIGLLVLALTSLVAYFTQTQAGIEKLDAVLQPLKAIFSALVGAVETLGSSLVAAFENPKKAMTDLYEFVKQNLINRFTAFGVILEGIINLDFKKVTNGVLQAGTGVENMTDKISGAAKKTSDFLSDAAKKGAEIAKLTREIDEAQLKYNKNQIAVNDAIDAQLLISKDTSKSFKERAAAAEEIIKITERNGQAESKILQLKLRQLQIQQQLKGAANLTNEEKQKEIDLLVAIDNAEDRGKEARIEQSKVLSGLKKEQRAQSEENHKKELENDKKKAEIAISTMKATLDYEIATYDQSEKLDSENIAHVQAISLMKQSIANAEMAKNLIGVKKGSQDAISIRNATAQEITKIEFESTKAIEKIKQDGADWEIELYHINNKTLIKEGAKLTDLLISQERKFLKEQIEVDKNGMRVKLGIDKNLSDDRLKLMLKTNAAMTASQKTYIKGVIKLEEEKAKVDKKLDDAEVASKVKNIDLLFKKEQDGIKRSKKSEAQKKIDEKKAEIKHIKEMQTIRKDDADYQKKIAEDLAKAEMELKEMVLQNAKDIARQSIDNIVAVAGEESAIGKAVAIARTLQNTYTSAMSAYDGMVDMFPGPWGIAAGVAAAATSVAFGLSNVSKIVGIKMFAEGTTDAPYTGKAIVDEEGAEIHTDASGNIKSFGSDSGAHLTDIVKGDKIIPADISAIIRQTMFSSYGMNAQNQVIDYDKLGAQMDKQFGKHASKIVSAVNNNGKNQLSVVVQKGISDRVIFRGKSV
jgi:hypothetical protein